VIVVMPDAVLDKTVPKVINSDLSLRLVWPAMPSRLSRHAGGWGARAWYACASLRAAI